MNWSPSFNNWPFPVGIVSSVPIELKILEYFKNNYQHNVPLIFRYILLTAKNIQVKTSHNWNISNKKREFLNIIWFYFQVSVSQKYFLFKIQNLYTSFSWYILSVLFNLYVSLHFLKRAIYLGDRVLSCMITHISALNDFVPVTNIFFNFYFCIMSCIFNNNFIYFI